MTIRQMGGVFGRNPDFNDVTANEVEANTVLANGVYGKADPNTGWTWSGSDILLGIAGGSERVRLTSSTALDVAGTSFFRGNMGLFSATGGAVPSSQLTFGSAALIDGGCIFSQTESATAASLYLATAQTGTGTMTNRLRLTAGGDVNVLNGNLVIGTSGKGIDFSATAGTGTSELFDDYEEGTWTPAVSAGISGVGYASQTGVYTKIGNLVTITGQISTNAGTATGDQFTLTGLPFAVGQIGGAFFTYLNTGVAASLWIASGSMFGYKSTGGNLSGTDLANAANTIIYFTGQYTAS